jgi:hypothetical protein
MKLIKFLLLGSVLITFACNNESDNAKQEASSKAPTPLARLTSTNLTTAKSLYLTMIATTAYSNYKAARTSFVTNMKTNAIYYTTKTQYMSWISTHLSSTSFGTTTAFSTAYDDVLSKYNIIVAANATLFNFIRNADADQLSEIYQPGLGTLPVYAPSSCVDDCLDAATIAFDANDSARSATLQACAGNAECENNVESYYWEVFVNICATSDACVNAC